MLTESDVIVAAVIVPIAVMSVVLLLFVATLCWVYRAKRESRYSTCDNVTMSCNFVYMIYIRVQLQNYNQFQT